MKKWSYPAETQDRVHRVLTVIGWILCVILAPILIVNCTLIVKSFIHKDEIPDFGGILPLIVLSDSMYPEIQGGDLIVCKTVDPDEIEEGDVVSFYDPEGNGTTVITHKVVEILNDETGRSFRTRGINNNTEDRVLVHEDKVVAEYTGVRIPGAGHVAIFMQSTAGLIVCVILPIILFVGYDVIRRRMYENKRGDDVAALKAELEALKAAQAETRAAEQSDTAEQGDDTPQE